MLCCRSCARPPVCLYLCCAAPPCVRSTAASPPQTIRRESPRIGGNFANWGLMFSVFDCTCLYIRKKVCMSLPLKRAKNRNGLLRCRHMSCHDLT